MALLPTAKTKKITDFSRAISMVYGMPGVGKSTFASKLPSSLFLATEPGQNFLEVFKVDINSWDDLLLLGPELAKNPNHGFKTLIIDTIDIMYGHCEKWICKKEGIKHISDSGFGKGYGLVKDEFQRVIFKFTNGLGLGIMFISHAKERSLEKTNTKFTIVDNSMGNSTSQFITSMCDFVFYGYINDKSERLMRLQPNKYIVAKNRAEGMPEIIKMDYDYFIKTYNETINKPVTKPITTQPTTGVANGK
jgi:GTPase SAR1 family protein